ncbi:ABC transporter ATP-binding protein [Clostridium sp. 19966]|uniref:ABC transporter ATP-binding protein n=1 Tax=Clostridium sp. 19966 TaxID=2768166 RepID=UPI0028E00086|nr:ABC transporter ATP-binding protein [Clostridium sp. 19966]MDT8718395.1 ABC transporter ATP-binding protein [Clostridium sp. 19966]
MFKKIINFSKLTIKSSPLYFSLNMIFVFIIALGWLVANYSGKLMVNSIIAAQSSKNFNFSVIFPPIIFFLAITVSGNYFNFQDMMVTMYTRKAKKFFSKLFLYKSYSTKQDKFYDSNFYNQYEFVKSNIASTTDITVSIFNNLALSLFNVLLSTSAILFFDPIILIFILALSIGLTFLNKYIVKKKVEINKKYVKYERKANYYSELLSGRKHAKELRIFNVRAFFLRNWEESYRKYTLAKFNFDMKSTILSNIVGFLQMIMVKGINLYFIYKVFLGTMNAGDCVFLIAVSSNITRNISSTINILTSDINEKYKYVDKFDDFTKDVDKNEADNNSKNGDFSLKYGDFKELKLSKVCFKYPHSEGNILKNIDFTLKKGEIVSILGYNGSGKTTFSKVMCGLLENYSGNITLNGEDIKKLPPEDLYKYFGIGFQEYAKYSVSLKENVALGMIEKFEDEKEIKKAMEKGHLENIIARLPQGENTILGKEYDKNGQDLSGGQWQRITLSRAYMGNPEILILDEPTASIDPLEEMRMLNQFKEIIKGKTALMISHRIGFARLSDRICIMENGRIVEEGSHEELLKLKGRYYELFTSQKDLYKEGAVS